MGLTTEQLTPDRCERLLAFGIGLTDLVQGKAGADRILVFDRADSLLLRSKMMMYQPQYLCFNGKRAAQEFFGHAKISYGVQQSGIGKTVIFVAPSTSAAANGSCDLSIWQDLARRVRRRRVTSPRRS